MDKRGAYVLGHKWVYFIIAIFVVGIIFLGMYSASLNYQMGASECITDVVDEVMTAKILYSPNCFVYFDEELDRAVPGTIDMSKFNNETLNSCFKFITKKAYLTIGDKSIGDQINNPKVINKPIYTYDNGVTSPNNLQLTFVESVC